MTPSKYKDGAANLGIRFAIAQSFLGLVLVAATERGVCTIDFGKTPEELTNRLRARFPKAMLGDDDPGFAARVAEVVAFIDAPRRGFGLPLDIRARRSSNGSGGPCRRSRWARPLVTQRLPSG